MIEPLGICLHPWEGVCIFLGGCVTSPVLHVVLCPYVLFVIVCVCGGDSFSFRFVILGRMALEAAAD